MLSLSWECNGMYTPGKINMEPEHDGFEDDYSFPGLYSQVLR